MAEWKSDLEALINDVAAFAKSVPVEPHAVAEPNRKPQVNWTKSEREEIVERVANFRAHQQRLMRQREDFAAAELDRMRTSHL
jgi:hypothetical protein